MIYDNGYTWHWDGSVRWILYNGDLQAKVFSDNFLASQHDYTRRVSQ